MAVSDLILGCMYFGTRTAPEDSFALLDRFVEAGGRTLDTADCYAFWVSESGAGGQSETLLGEWLSERAALRPELEIATKVGPEPVVPGQFDRPVGLSAEVVRRSVDASRERLGIEQIDLYWAHLEDRSVPIEEVAETFGSLVDEGDAKRIGISNHPTWRVERARQAALREGIEPFTALQLTDSYLRPRPDAAVPGKDHRFGFVTDETRDYLDENPGLELWVYSPLVQGSYDREDRPFPEVYDHPGSTRRREALRGVADEVGLSQGETVLAWMLAHGHRPIVGVSSVEQLDSALRAAEVTLTPDQLAALDAPA